VGRSRVRPNREKTATSPATDAALGHSETTDIQAVGAQSEPMEKTDAGTSVGVENPYEYVDRCDHLTDEGKCRFAVEYGDADPQFARERRREEYQCPVAGDPEEAGATGSWEWEDCPHFRCRNRERECLRCGLAEQRMAHDDDRPLLEEHHLSYADTSAEGTGETSHEITVFLCRWCHAYQHTTYIQI